MRTYEEYRQILELWELGINKLQIAKVTGIPRPTVRDCIKRYSSIAALDEVFAEEHALLDFDTWNDSLPQTYVYLLAVYLGDGYISKVNTTYRLRIALDSKYPNIIHQVSTTIQTVLPQNKVGIQTFKNSKGIEVNCYSNYWPRLFPQHGAGTKHTRKIALEQWQSEMVQAYPIEFLRGFIHTDGCRVDAVVNGTVYPRYQFSNISEDILTLFTDTCLALGLSCTRYKRNLTIAKRDDVAFLDRVIGPKTWRRHRESKSAP